MKEKKMTVVGDVDPVEVINKLRKSFCAELLTVEPAKEEKKDGDKKKEGNNEKKDGNKKKSEAEQIAELEKANKCYNPSICYNHSAEENPNACVIF
ncbi:hypothetical protein Leryth_003212 [Lithospermum erythrorhizon]|nr:hypothetical protein Leryth_003212 [Lithospermum erythrorhizon]